MPAMEVASTWPSPLKRLLHRVGEFRLHRFVGFSPLKRLLHFLMERASLFHFNQIYSSGYISRVPYKGADTPRNEVHGMCFEFAGKDAG